MVKETIAIEELKKMAEKMFGNLVKAVVDVDQEIMVIDAELHADEEYFLLEEGSQQEHLWGINIFPDKVGTEQFIQFDAIINIRPTVNNLTVHVNDQKVREKIKNIMDQLIKH